MSKRPIIRFDPDGQWDVTVHVNKNRDIDGYGIAVVTDISGNNIFSFVVRAEGTGGRDRMVENSDTPLWVYDIPDKTPWFSGGNRKSYGPNPRLVMIPESGEIIDSGRDQIRIHGGQQEELKNGEWTPIENPSLKKTHGCLRAYDSDMLEFYTIVRNLEKDNTNEHPGKVIIIDDKEEYEH